MLLCLLAACDTGSQRRLDPGTLQEEMRRREPRRIKEGEIAAAGQQQGQTIVAVLQANSLADSSNCCPRILQSMLDSLQNQYQAQIKCYSLLDQHQIPESTLEQQVLDAYRYNVEQSLPLESNIQTLGKEHFIYNAPATNGVTTKKPCAVWSIWLSRKEIVLRM